MKRRISLLFCLTALVLCFTGCASGRTTEQNYNKANVEQVTEFLIDYCANADEASMEQWKSMSDFALEQQLTAAGLPVTPESFLGALDAWSTAVEECGAYKTHGDYTYEPSPKELLVTTEAEFEERSAKITFVFDDKSYLKSMTVDGDYTRGEILTKAGQNTLLGMGTVFLVLIFISIVISLFRFIPAIQNAFTKKPVQADQRIEEIPAVVPQTAVKDKVGTENDLELVAVIAAAIAASEGTTTDGFVVRSIKRRQANRWN